MKKWMVVVLLVVFPATAFAARFTVYTQSLRIISSPKVVKQSVKSFDDLQNAQCASLYAQNTSALVDWIMSHPHDFVAVPIAWKFRQRVVDEKNLSGSTWRTIGNKTVYGEWHTADMEAMYESFIEAQWDACD